MEHFQGADGTDRSRTATGACDAQAEELIAMGVFEYDDPYTGVQQGAGDGSKTI